MKKRIIFLLILFSALWLGGSAFGAIIIGRVAHMEGKIYRYMAGDQSWVETFVDSPAGTQDILATGDNSRAEITFPNNVLVRLDANAEIEILNLEEDLGVFIQPRGLARFYNLSATAILTVETVRGTAKLGPGSALDVQVDGNVVVVSSVQGATTFHTLENGQEKQEVISGSTSLKFREDAIIAAAGSLDGDWDRWCGNRENVRYQNLRVSSEYLPASMQEDAYVLEPNGNWRRVYYQGYNYWAWQPRHVAAGWAPYTTGYWYDWQGEPVWIDQNPWGWVTHHHGHWIEINGAWMWTPYVHVANVPGVAVAGFNITFGKAYRPYWHPGRVRWISHSSHIGWLPLAPWETYYGHRRWDPRSVVVHGGVDFSININLAQHKYVDHAVIIPKRYLHQRGPVVINNYNTVKIKNSNRTIISNNYRPIATMDETRDRKREASTARTVRAEVRAAVQPERSMKRKRQAVVVEKHGGKDGLAVQAQKNGLKKEGVDYRRQTPVMEKTGAVEKTRAMASTERKPTKVGSSELLIQAEKIEKRGEKALQKSNGVKNKSQRSNDIGAKSRQKKKEDRPAVALGSNMSGTKQKNATAIVGQNSRKERIEVQGQTRVTPIQVQQKEARRGKKYNGNSSKDDENAKREETNPKKNIAGKQQYSTPRNTSREPRGDRQRPGGNIVSASLGNQRFR